MQRYLPGYSTTMIRKRILRKSCLLRHGLQGSPSKVGSAIFFLIISRQASISAFATLRDYWWAQNIQTSNILKFYQYACTVSPSSDDKHKPYPYGSTQQPVQKAVGSTRRKKLSDLASSQANAHPLYIQEHPGKSTWEAPNFDKTYINKTHRYQRYLRDWMYSSHSASGFVSSYRKKVWRFSTGTLSFSKASSKFIFMDLACPMCK